MSSATTTSRAADWFATHRATLDGAREAIRTRAFFSAYFEVPSAKAYGETAAAEGKAAFDARIGKPFVLDQPGTTGHLGSERSPFGIELERRHLLKLEVQPMGAFQRVTYAGSGPGLCEAAIRLPAQITLPAAVPAPRYSEGAH